METILIENIRLNPVLYDTTHRDYRNQQVRNDAWDNIGKIIGLSGNECKDSWNKLRNAHIQALRRRTSKTGQSRKFMGKWKYEDEMSFLKPTRRMLRNAEEAADGVEEVHPALSSDEESKSPTVLSSQEDSQLLKPRENSYPSENVITTTEFSRLSQPLPLQSNFEKPDTTYVRSKKRFGSPVEQMIEIMKKNSCLRNEYLNDSLAASSEEDESDLFFRSLAKSVKKLDLEEQIKVKMEVSRIVFQAELRHAQKQQPHSTPSTSQQSEQSYDDLSLSQSHSTYRLRKQL